MANNQDPRYGPEGQQSGRGNDSRRAAQHDSVDQESLTDYEDFFRQETSGRLRTDNEPTTEHPSYVDERYSMNNAGGVATAPIPPSEAPEDTAKSKGRVRRILLWVLAGFLAYSLALTAVSLRRPVE